MNIILEKKVFAAPERTGESFRARKMKEMETEEHSSCLPVLLKVGGIVFLSPSGLIRTVAGLILAE